MPEWAEKLALQFPIVALIGVAVWLALRYADGRQDDFLRRERPWLKSSARRLRSSLKHSDSRSQTSTRGHARNWNENERQTTPESGP